MARSRSDDHPDSGLGAYRAKRDFAASPEPDAAPSAPTGPEGGGNRFVIQEHHATSLHWDLRLERNGVLASWAVPKGIPPDPRVNHLAVHTEDHPLEYLTFQGTIPPGNYGAGEMTVWDHGTYESEKFGDGEVIFTLHGRRAHGRHALVRTGGTQWLLHRMDPPEDPTRELVPTGWSPMQAVPSDLPGDERAWAFEVDWGGIGVVVAYEGGRVAEALDADGSDAARPFPELAGLGEALGALPVVLAGEMVVLGSDGRPEAGAISRRRSARSVSAIRRLAADRPATFIVSDLLWLDGHSAVALPWRDRRRLLEGLDLNGPRWATPPAHVGEGGAALLEAAAAQGLPGIVAKAVDSPYQPGTRPGTWLAVPAGAGVRSGA